ncbi:hypothetical protein TRVA0_015S01464 [Trichomonascus vanleenenianus]|uniref:Yip3p n=1 Tax=Trichomonascus vanleenenianus TaxID=2268995 RepID=UPI003ECB61EB
MSLGSFASSLQLGSLTGRFGYERLQTEAGALRSRFSNVKSLTDFFDIKRMSKPQGWGDAQSRINFNLSYFSTNYAIVFALLSVYSLLTNLLLLFVIGFVVLGMLGIGALQGQDLDLRFTTIPTSSLYTGLFIIAIPLGIFASPLSTILWLIGASGVTILGHAAIMEKPIESAFGEEQV